MPFYQIFPLGSGFVFALAAISLKRAMHEGAGPWRTLFVTHVCGVLSFSLFLLLPGKSLGTISWRLPALAGVAFFAGQVFTFLALNRGEVSVATPMLGTKALIVAALTTFVLGETVPLSWWIAAGMATLAIGLMQGGPAHDRDRALFTLLTSALGAGAFAATDVIVQRGAPGMGFQRFIPAMFLVVFGLSFGLIPLFQSSWQNLSVLAWGWLLAGAVLLTAQSLGMAYSIAVYGHATAINVIYTSRGIWSVALVWRAGHWFGNDEREAGHPVMARRLAGAALIIVAIILVSLK